MVNIYNKNKVFIIKGRKLIMFNIEDIRIEFNKIAQIPKTSHFKKRVDILYSYLEDIIQGKKNIEVFSNIKNEIELITNIEQNNILKISEMMNISNDSTIALINNLHQLFQVNLEIEEYIIEFKEKFLNPLIITNSYEKINFLYFILTNRIIDSPICGRLASITIDGFQDKINYNLHISNESDILENLDITIEQLKDLQLIVPLTENTIIRKYQLEENIYNEIVQPILKNADLNTLKILFNCFESFIYTQQIIFNEIEKLNQLKKTI
jgi:hypothetical protein